MSPSVSQENFLWRRQPQTSPVNLSLKFDARAVLTSPSFKVELHDVAANSCGPNVLRDVRPDLQPPPAPGGSSSASEVLDNGEYCLRTHADMNHQRWGDVVGSDYFFTVANPASGGGGVGGGGGTPGYSLALGGSGQPFHYGDNARLTLTLTPSNGFSDTVSFTIQGQPSLTSGGWSFVPSASINAGSSNRSLSLQGIVTPALFVPGSNSVSVLGVAQRSGLRASTSGTLIVGRTQGDFTHVYPQPQVPAAAQLDCPDGTANVHVSYASFGPNDFRVTYDDLQSPPQGKRSCAQAGESRDYFVQYQCRLPVDVLI
jgi:hypothetical protein